MTRLLTCAALLWLLAGSHAAAADGNAAAPGQILPPVTDPLPIVVRPAMLGDHIGSIAGHRVQMPSARIVGQYGPRAFVVEMAARYRETVPTRILVVLDAAALRVPAERLVGETVTVSGVARTLLGLQVGGDVALPEGLDRRRARRMAIRAAVLASSVQTAEGIELTSLP